MLPSRRLLASLVLFILLGFVLSPVTVLASRFPTNQLPAPDWETLFKPGVYERLQQQAVANGAVPVIVRLNVDYQPEGRLMSARETTQQRAAISRVQQNVLNKLGTQRFSAAKHFEFIPFLSLTVDTQGLALLQTLPEVAGIEEDIIFDTALADSVALIGATPAQTAGYTGAGQTVAILDTGVDKNHPFLAGKVVSEACYSTTNTGINFVSICPGGVSESIAAGSGMYCTGISGCDHGTHVAGIAAGKGDTFSGVASDATIIAVQVFSMEGGSVKALTSDVIRGLERVYALRNDFNIAAVNLSLGGGQYSTNCDSDFPATKAAIDNLRSVGIATIASSGNSSYTTAMGSPACISTAVSVGSTTASGEYGYPVDTVAPSSNSASFLSLLAPGYPINSSIPGNSYALKQGTSMAAPHVAGAWAVLKSKNPTISVDQILNALSSTGLMVNDTRVTNGFTRPRIRVNAALDVLPGATPVISFAATSPVLVAENQPSVSVDVQLSTPGTSTVTVQYETSSGTAQATSDFQSGSGQLTFLPGETTQQITIPILDDSLDEIDETFTITLTNPANAVFAANQTLEINIQDDDDPSSVRLKASTYSLGEGEGGIGIAVELSAPSGKIVVVHYSTSDGTAVAGKDYTATSGQLTFDPGTVEQVFNVPILPDSTDEAAEIFSMALTNPSNALLAIPDQATITIEDDDPEPGVQFATPAMQVLESAGNVPVVVKLSAISEKPVTVRYRVNAGSATPGVDYTGGQGTLTFAPGVREQEITITVLDDTEFEPAEVFVLELYDLANAAAGQPIEIEVLITDDDDQQTYPLYLPIVTSNR